MFNVNLVNKESYKNEPMFLFNNREMTIACMCDKKVIKLDCELQDLEEKYIPWGTSTEEKAELKKTPEYQRRKHICPSCGEEYIITDFTAVTERVVSYIIFDDSEQGKLREAHITMNYYLKKGVVLYRRITKRTVLNLDTGMTYALPSYINGKKPVRGRKAVDNMLKNVTYVDSFFGIGFLNGEAIDNLSNVRLAVINKIINYKKEKFNIKFYKSPLLQLTDGERYEHCMPKAKTFDLRNKRRESKKDVCLSDSYNVLTGNIKKVNLSLLNRYPSLYMENFQEFCDKGDAIYADVKGLRAIKHYDEFNFNNLKKRGFFINKKVKKHFNTSIRVAVAYSQLGAILTKTDNIDKLIEGYKDVGHNLRDLNDVIKFLRLYKWKYKKIFARTENEVVNHLIYLRGANRGYELMDTLEMFCNNYRASNFKFSFRNLTDTHDRLAGLDRLRLSKKDNKDITYDEEEQVLGLNTEALDFRLAKSTGELILVGGEMGICVGGYGERAFNKELYIVVAYKGDVPFICIEVSNDGQRIEQFKFKRNQRLRNILPKLEENEKNSIDEYLNYLGSKGPMSAGHDLENINLEVAYKKEAKITKTIELYLAKKKELEAQIQRDDLPTIQVVNDENVFDNDDDILVV